MEQAKFYAIKTGCFCPVCNKEILVGDTIDTTYTKKAEAYTNLLEACKDPFSYTKGDFADGLLELAGKLQNADPVCIATWRLWLLSKAEQLQQAIANAKKGA